MPAKTLTKRTTDEVLARLAELGGKLGGDDTLAYEGTKLILPAKWTLKEAITFLQRKEEDEEQTATFVRTFRYRPWDGAHALEAAFIKTFGTLLQKDTKTMFGKRPPARIDIEVGPGQMKQVPWGQMEVPGMPGLEIVTHSVDNPELGYLFAVTATGPKKYRHQVEGLFKVIEEELRTNSIYRGKAIDGQDQARFLDLRGVDERKVIYSDEVMTQLDANIWAILSHPQAMRDLGMSLKRAVLLHGPFGTGKTLAAYLTAKRAVDNGWTFIMVRPGKDDLMACMQTARLYQPAVVFYEDIDVVGNGDDDHVAKLLDAFDGISAKGTEIVVVLTTNHPEKIHKGMVRPGRLDAVIEIAGLDRRGVERMVEACVPAAKLAEPLDFDRIHAAFDGMLPAFVKEGIERTMRYAIARAGRVEGLVTEDFIAAADGLRPQLALMQAPAHENEVTVEDLMGEEIRRQLDGAQLVYDDRRDVSMLRLNGAKR